MFQKQYSMVDSIFQNTSVEFNRIKLNWQKSNATLKLKVLQDQSRNRGCLTGRQKSTWNWTTERDYVQSPAPALTSCVTPGNLLNLPMPQFLHL